MKKIDIFLGLCILVMLVSFVICITSAVNEDKETSGIAMNVGMISLLTGWIVGRIERYFNPVK